ncbi:hypothetical protein D3C77_351900 [compost metagenome]
MLAEVAGADANAVQLAAHALELYLLLLVLLLESGRFADRTLEIAGHLPSRHAGAGQVLAKRLHAIAGSLQGGTGLLTGRA